MQATTIILKDGDASGKGLNVQHSNGSLRSDSPDEGLTSESDEDEFADVIASLNPADLQALAMDARRTTCPSDYLDCVICVVTVPPCVGSSNIVYQARFTDGVCWAIRVPGDKLTSEDARAMELDIVAQRLIASRTSLPIPHIYSWSIGCDNRISRPFTIMDFASGVNLSKVWHDKDWMTPAKREYIFEQLSQWMTELSALEFDHIGCLGCLDLDRGTGVYRVVPFPDSSTLTACTTSAGSVTSAGPFNSVHAFLTYKLTRRRQESDDPMLAIFHFFLSALPDPDLDGPPFVLCHPDFEYQNVLVADDGTITALIDWDGIFVGPRQGGAAAYPWWLTTDWDPAFHGWYEENSVEENAEFDSSAELERYREQYLAAMDRASSGKLTHITRNSHVFQSLDIGLSDTIPTVGVFYHLSTFVFGNRALAFDVKEGTRLAGWYNLKKDAIAQCREVTTSELLVSSDLGSADVDAVEI